MTGHVVFSERWDGSDRVYLSQLAPIRGLKFSHGLPGGPLEASWSFLAKPDYDHRALAHNRRIGIVNGGGHRAWTGALNAPERGNPWSCKADGLGALAIRYRAFPIPITASYFDPNNVLGQAVGRGLPWSLPAGLPVGAGTAGTQTPDMSCADLLNHVFEQNGQTWWIDSNGWLKYGSPLALPTHLFCPSEPGGGRALSENYVSGFLAFFKSVTSGADSIYFGNDQARTDKWGSAEQPLDLTNYGSLTSAQVVSIVNAFLTIHPPHVPFSGQFALTRGQILSAPGGSISEPSALQPPVTGQLIVTDVDHAAEFDTSKPTYVWVQQTDYDDDLDTVAITPWDSSGDDMKAMLTGAVKSWARERSVFA